jgi:hypothetical protein
VVLDRGRDVTASRLAWLLAAGSAVAAFVCAVLAIWSDAPDSERFGNTAALLGIVAMLFTAIALIRADS